MGAKNGREEEEEWADLWGKVEIMTIFLLSFISWSGAEVMGEKDYRMVAKVRWLRRLFSVEFTSETMKSLQSARICCSQLSTYTPCRPSIEEWNSLEEFSLSHNTKQKLSCDRDLFAHCNNRKSWLTPIIFPFSPRTSNWFPRSEFTSMSWRETSKFLHSLWTGIFLCQKLWANTHNLNSLDVFRCLSISCTTTTTDNRQQVSNFSQK